MGQSGSKRRLRRHRAKSSIKTKDKLLKAQQDRAIIEEFDDDDDDAAD